MRSSEPRDPFNYKPHGSRRGFKNPRRVSRRVKAAAAVAIAAVAWTFYNVPTVLSVANNLLGAIHHGFAAIEIMFRDPDQTPEPDNGHGTKSTSEPMAGGNGYFVGNGLNSITDTWFVGIDLMGDVGHPRSSSGDRSNSSRGLNYRPTSTRIDPGVKKPKSSDFVQDKPRLFLPETRSNPETGARKETVSVAADQSMIVQTIMAKGERILAVCGIYARSLTANGNATGDVQLARNDIEECRNAAVYIHDNKQHVSNLVASNPALESAIRQGERLFMFDNALAKF